MTLPVKAVLSNLSPEGETLYRLLAVGTKKISEAEYLQLLSQKSGVDETKCRFWLDCERDVLYGCLAENGAVDIGYLYAKLYPTGTIASLADQPTKEANPVKARAFFKGAFAEKIAKIELVNTTLTVNAILYEIMQDGASDVNRIESTTERIVINGNEIKIVSSQQDNGVWLENMQTGLKVATATISYSDQSICHCTFPTLPPTGQYRLVLATRNGESADDYALACVTRNVQVVNEEE